MKCGISQAELEVDAFGLIDVFNMREGDQIDPFTKEDVLAALISYPTIRK